MKKESVWDYPRPPRLEPCPRRARVIFGGEIIADSTRALRVLETSHPPTIYFPAQDVRREFLRAAPGRSFCEWKGAASYWTVAAGGKTAERAAWSYERPTPPFDALAGHLAFYPGRMDACFLDDEAVTAQPGDFYGGWITADIEGPFKGGPGSAGW
jgi:uncharacterized protein (DUF427 family)